MFLLLIDNIANSKAINNEHTTVNNILKIIKIIKWYILDVLKIFINDLKTSVILGTTSELLNKCDNKNQIRNIKNIPNVLNIILLYFLVVEIFTW